MSTGPCALFDASLQLVEDGTPLAVRVLVERAYLEVRDRDPVDCTRRSARSPPRRATGSRRSGPAPCSAARCSTKETLRGRRCLTRAIEEARDAGDVDLECTAAFHLVSGLGLVGRRRESIDICVREIEVSEAAGLRTWRAHFLTALVLNRSLGSDDPHGTATAAAQLIEEHTLFRNRFQSETSQVLALADLDRFDEAAAPPSASSTRRRRPRRACSPACR